MPSPSLEVPLRRSAIALALACLTPAPTSAQDVSVAHSMWKVRSDEPGVPSATSASISAARNEFEAFQLVVRGPATDVTATASALTGPGAAIIPAASCDTAGDVRLYREALYWVDPTRKSDVHSMTGWIPDALVPQVDEFDDQCRAFSFSVPAGEHRVIWADVHVPQDAVAGTYTGTVTVRWTGGSRIIPVTLQVWDFALPSTASLRSYFGYPYNALTVQHGAPACSSELSALLQRYAVLALDHRMSFTMLDDGCSYTDVTGAYTTRYGSLFDGTARTRLRGARATGIVFMGDRSSAASLTAWADHFKSRGWFDRLFEYAADEPGHLQPWTVIGPRARLAHSVDPRFRILVVTSIERARAAAPTNDFSLQDVDVFVPNVDQLEPAPGGNTRWEYDSWLAGADVKEVWQYQSCDAHGCGDAYPVGSDVGAGYYPRWPSYTIDASLVRARALEWFSFKNDLSGELYYSTADAFFGTDPGPWVDQWGAYTGHGDGTLFYPGVPARIGGSTHIPVASMRMRMIREGMEDYEYMRLLDSHGDRPFALEQFSTVFGPASDADRDPQALYAARERMACRILANLGRPCPVAEPTACDADDCFSRPDGALGPAWNVFAPGIEISSGEARSTTTGTKGAQFLEDVGVDQDVSVKCLVTGSGSNCALLARYNDANNYYYAYLDAGLGRIDLWRKSGGTATLLGSATRTLSTSTYHPLRLLVRGSTLEVYVEGEASPAIAVTDTAITTGRHGGIHGYAGGSGAVRWDDFEIVAAPAPARPPLFSDDFDRTTGLGASWSIRSGSFGTDGTHAVSGPPPAGGNWARVVPSLGTSDYSVVAQIVVPAGSSRSGIFARGAEGAKVDRALYAAQVSTTDGGSVDLYRRSKSTWTHLATAAASIVPGTTYTLELSVNGANPVHLEVRLDGSLQIGLDDASPSRITSGVPGIHSYDEDARYDSFRVELP